jgi:hypothetical protein
MPPGPVPVGFDSQGFGPKTCSAVGAPLMPAGKVAEVPPATAVEAEEAAEVLAAG